MYQSFLVSKKEKRKHKTEMPFPTSELPSKELPPPIGEKLESLSNPAIVNDEMNWVVVFLVFLEEETKTL